MMSIVKYLLDYHFTSGTKLGCDAKSLRQPCMIEVADVKTLTLDMNTKVISWRFIVYSALGNKPSSDFEGLCHFVVIKLADDGAMTVIMGTPLKSGDRAFTAPIPLVFLLPPPSFSFFAIFTLHLHISLFFRRVCNRVRGRHHARWVKSRSCVCSEQKDDGRRRRPTSQHLLTSFSRRVFKFSMGSGRSSARGSSREGCTRVLVLGAEGRRRKGSSGDWFGYLRLDLGGGYSHLPPATAAGRRPPPPTLLFLDCKLIKLMSIVVGQPSWDIQCCEFRDSDCSEYMARTRLIKAGIMMTERVCLVSLSDGDWYVSHGCVDDSRRAPTIGSTGSVYVSGKVTGNPSG
ncbi:hypothetical protein LXL04_037490 [Taraxacum kok-saghyz]